MKKDCLFIYKGKEFYSKKELADFLKKEKKQTLNVKELPEYKKNNILLHISNNLYKNLVPLLLSNNGKITLENTIENVFLQLVNTYKSIGNEDFANFIEENKEELIGTNSNSELNLYNKIKQISKSSIENFTLDDSGTVSKDYSTESFELSAYKGLSTRLRLLLSNVVDTRVESPIAGLDILMDSFDVLEAIQQVMAKISNNDMDSVIAYMENMAKKDEKEFGFYKQIADILSNKNGFVFSDFITEQLKSEILYKLFLPKIEMKKIFISENEGSISLQILDSNTNSPRNIVVKEFTNNLKLSKLIVLHGDSMFKVNSQELDRVINLYDKILNQYYSDNDIIGNPKNINTTDFKELLESLGISLTDKLIDSIIDGSDYMQDMSENSLTGKISTVSLLLGSKNKKGYSMLGTVINNLKNIKDGNYSFENHKNPKVIRVNPLLQNNSSFYKLIEKQIDSKFIRNTSIYEAGKTVYAYQQPNQINSLMKVLKNDIIDFIEERKRLGEQAKPKGELKRQLDAVNNKDSFLLNLLIDNPEEFLGNYDSFLESLEPLKNKNKSQEGITSLSDGNFDANILGFFSNSVKDKVKNTERFTELYGEIPMRIGFITSPALADSSQLFLFQLPLIAINENLVKDDKIDKGVLKILSDSLVKNDIRRIVDYLLKIKFNNNYKESNVEFYDNFADIITSIPELNTVNVPYVNSSGENSTAPLSYVLNKFVKDSLGQEGALMEQLFLDVNQNTEQENDKITSFIDNIVNSFISTHEKDINETINNHITFEANRILNQIKKEGFLKEDGSFRLKNTTGTSNYFEKDPMIVAYDYVINYILSQRDIQNIYAGDLSFYGKSKKVKNINNSNVKTTFLDLAKVNLTKKEFVEFSRKYKDGLSKLPTEEKSILLKQYPWLGVADEFLHLSGVNVSEIHRGRQGATTLVVNEAVKELRNNLSKRLKKLMSPGLQQKNAYLQPDYLQLMVSDVESISTDLLGLVERNIPEVLKQNPDLKESIKLLLKLNKQYINTGKKPEGYESLYDYVENLIPQVSAYMNTKDTDAMEYCTYKEYVDHLLNKGAISEMQADYIMKKMEAQQKDIDEKGTISEENKLTQEDLDIFNFQTLKQVYSGSVDMNVNGHIIQRPMFVKSSTIPLYPELTVGWEKLENRRAAMETLQKKTGMNVRLSYASANKVGAVSNAISIQSVNKDTDVNILLNSSVRMRRAGLLSQSEQPYHDKENGEKGLVDMQSTKTQFEKIILGNGISQDGRKIFPASNFDKKILNELDIKEENGNISGVDLAKIYFKVNSKRQEIALQNVLQKFGFDSMDNIDYSIPENAEKLEKILKQGLDNQQDIDAVTVLYKVKEKEGHFTKKQVEDNNLTPISAETTLPILMTPNFQKIESLLNSFITNNITKKKLPGHHYIVASQEGFDYITYDKNNLKKLSESGMIFTPNFDPTVGLKPNQVFVANKFRVWNVNTGKYDLIDLKKISKRGKNGLLTIDTTKLPENIFNLFSMRIPTSAHQSGNLIEIAGFLPDHSADTMIVSKDSTIQIGEDYDIDSRYTYTLNIVQDDDGLVRPMDYNDLNKYSSAIRPNITLSDLWKDFLNQKEELWNRFYTRTIQKDGQETINPVLGKIARERFEKLIEIELLKKEKEEIISYEIFNKLSGGLLSEDLNSLPKKDVIDSLLESLSKSIPDKNLEQQERKELAELYRKLKNEIQEIFNSELNELQVSWNSYKDATKFRINEDKVIENNLINVYKSVFGSQDTEIRNLINSTINTDFSEKTASKIEETIESTDSIYSVYFPTTQRNVIKSGSAGKIAIGSHSNTVTFTSLLQQIPELQKLEFKKRINGVLSEIPDKIILGNFTFDGTLGAVFDKRNNRISQYIMELQNSATDNQKLEIMNRRNENKHTMSVLGFMQMVGLENDGINIKGIGVLSYSSLFISQPIIRKLVNQLESKENLYGKPLTNIDIDNYFRDLFLSLKNNVKGLDEYIEYSEKKGFKVKEKLRKLASSFDSESLFNSLLTKLDATSNAEDIAKQFYIYTTYKKFQKMQSDVAELQRIINIEASGVGISFFDVIDKLKTLKYFAKGYLDINISTKENKNPFTSMIGESLFIESEDTAKINEAKNSGYILVEDNGNEAFLVKPTTFYGYKIVNSISAAYQLYKPLFPYNSPVINNSINSILDNIDDQNDKEKIKYDIIKRFQDYLYSSVNITNNEHLFLGDTNGNISLGEYLLKNIFKNPQYSHIANSPFFKDLIIILNSSEFPTTIEINRQDFTEQGQKQIEYFLKNFSESQEELPDWNGEKMTNEKLIKNLFAYSLKEKTSFKSLRNLMPISLFTKYGVDKTIRDNFNSKNHNDILNIAVNKLGNFFNGVFDLHNNLSYEEVKEIVKEINNKAESSVLFLYGDKDYFTVEIAKGNVSVFNTFGKQYIQNNPELVNTAPYKASEFIGDILSIDLNLLTNKEREIYEGLSFLKTMDNEGNISLYQEIGSTADADVLQFRKINTLGNNSIQEFSFGKEIEQSVLETNNTENKQDNTPITNKVDNDVIYRKYEEVSTFRNLLVDILRNKNNNLHSLAMLFKDFIPEIEDVSFRVEPSENMIGKNASFSIISGIPTIKISSAFLDSKPSKSEVEKVVFEEIFHYMTTNTIGEYITITGFANNEISYNIKDKYLESGIPESLTELLKVYNQAISYYINTPLGKDLKKALENYKKVKSNKELESEEENTIYRIGNIHEFLIGLFMKDEKFSQEMSKVRVDRNNNFLLSFLDAVKKFLLTILPKNARVNSISAKALSELYNLIAFDKANRGYPTTFIGAIKTPNSNITNTKNKMSKSVENPANLEKLFSLKKLGLLELTEKSQNNIVDYNNFINEIVSSNKYLSLVTEIDGKEANYIRIKDDEMLGLNKDTSFSAAVTLMLTINSLVNRGGKNIGNIVKLEVRESRVFLKLVATNSQKKLLEAITQEDINKYQKIVNEEQDYIDKSKMDFIENSKLFNEVFGTEENDNTEEFINQVINPQFLGKSSSLKVEEFKGFWNRQQVASESDKVFLFGDNTNDRTVTKYVPSTTQAVIRGLPNAIGIDTKKDRGTSASSYLTDKDFEWFKNHIDTQIQKAKNSGKTIVIPEDGIGTGKAMLKEKAPKLFEYLQQELNKLKTSPQKITYSSNVTENNVNDNKEGSLENASIITPEILSKFEAEFNSSENLKRKYTNTIEMVNAFLIAKQLNSNLTVDNFISNGKLC